MLHIPNKHSIFIGSASIMVVFPCCTAAAMASTPTLNVSGEIPLSSDSKFTNELYHGCNRPSNTKELKYKYIGARHTSLHHTSLLMLTSVYCICWEEGKWDNKMINFLYNNSSETTPACMLKVFSLVSLC